MEKIRKATVTLIGVVLVLILAVSNPEVTLVLLAAVLASASISRLCGPI